ncbi:MAG: CPBP family intramembrane glutamic endopeptidase [Nocardioides sp.]
MGVEPRPTGRDVLVTLAAGLLLPVLTMVAWAVVVLIADLPREWFALALVWAVIAMAAGIWWALVRRLGWGRAALGYTRASVSLWHLLWEIPASITASLVFVAVVSPLLFDKPPQSETDTATVALLSISPALLVVGGLLVVVVVPLLEEVLFRRVLLDWLRWRLGVWAAVPLSATAFAGVHLAPAAMLYLFPLALCFALLRIRHDTLWASALLHMVNNAFAFSVALAALS